MRKTTLAFIVMLSMLAMGCETLDKKASDATYLAIAPEYVAYVSSSSLSKTAKRRRHRTTYTWGNRLGQDTSFIPYKPGGE